MIEIDGYDIEFKINNINPTTLRDMITRSHFDRGVFLNLVLEYPKLSAYEWYSRVPSTIIDKIMDEINKCVEVSYV